MKGKLGRLPVAPAVKLCLRVRGRRVSFVRVPQHTQNRFAFDRYVALVGKAALLENVEEGSRCDLGGQLADAPDQFTNSLFANLNSLMRRKKSLICAIGNSPNKLSYCSGLQRA